MGMVQNGNGQRYSIIPGLAYGRANRVLEFSSKA